MIVSKYGKFIIELNELGEISNITASEFHVSCCGSYSNIEQYLLKHLIKSLKHFLSNNLKDTTYKE